MNFTEMEAQDLSRQIDQRLQELRAQRLASGSLKSGDSQDKQIPEQESQAIEKATGEPVENFLKKFGRVAHKDLCVEGGTLHAQWKRFGDLNNKDLIATFGPLLVDLGIRGEVVPIVLVSVAVIVLDLSVKTICEEYGHES